MDLSLNVTGGAEESIIIEESEAEEDDDRESPNPNESFSYLAQYIEYTIGSRLL